FILLRRNLPNIERPYRSPLGIPGAVATLAIAVVTLYMQLQDPVYQYGVYGAAIWYAIGILYFALIGRHKLVYSRAEDFVVRERQKSMGHACSAPLRQGAAGCWPADAGVAGRFLAGLLPGYGSPQFADVIVAQGKQPASFRHIAQCVSQLHRTF